MQGRRLAVLMWKHLTVRKRRYIQTPIEIFSTIMFFVIIFCFKDNINPPQVSRSPDVNNMGTILPQDLPAPVRVLYTPDNGYTKYFMEIIAKRLHLEKLEKLPDTERRYLRNHVISKAEDLNTGVNMLLDRVEHKTGFYPFKNFSEISHLIKNLYSNEAIVEFDSAKEADGKYLFEQFQLIYTIRMKNAFFANTYEPMGGTLKPHRQFGTIYHQFIRLQWTIETSYFVILTSIRNYDRISRLYSFQEFPSHNEEMPVVYQPLQFCCWMSLFLVFVFLMSRLLEERSTGIQELIKMAGVSRNLFVVSHFLNVLPAGLMYSVGGTVLLTVSSNPLIECSPFLIAIMLALHFVSIIAIAFACSYITQNTQYTVSLSVLVYVVLWLPKQIAARFDVNGVAVLTGLLPHVPMQWFWTEAAQREQNGKGLSFSDIFSSHSPYSGPVLLGFMFLVLQAVFFFVLAWYLSLVRPGKYGQALPWNFFLQKQYWSKNEVKPDANIDEEVHIAREAKYFEEPPANLEPGIRIENVSKVFGKHKVLSNVTLNVYKGEITVLLGHNGAGKTTLMSIITGMSRASSGRVLVAGAEPRLGLCPQHNLCFADLTVLQHAVFFALLKGGTFKECRQSSLALLARLGLQEKASVLSGALSGGMKRRLQLACALAGGASVLVLDEPTSGLDVETRRDLWDLLLSLRGERTVLLTTHFMEEADALGDRVAALHRGRVRCHASPMHLKRALGTGYRLTFTTSGPAREAAVSAAVTSHVPEAALTEQSPTSLSYSLPAAASARFPALFSALEERRSELGIETIGVGVSTLEEVFLKLCSDTYTFNEVKADSAKPKEHESFTSGAPAYCTKCGKECIKCGMSAGPMRTSMGPEIAKESSPREPPEPTFNKVTGQILYCRQFWVLLKRQFKYVWYKKISFIFLQAVIPILMICIITKITNNDRQIVSKPPRKPPQTDKVLMDLDIYKTMPERRVLYTHDSNVMRDYLRKQWPGVQFKKTKNVAKELQEMDVTDYNKYLAGIEINETYKALFTTVYRHAAPVAVNLLSNTVSARVFSKRMFFLYLHPITTDDVFALDDKSLIEPKSMDLAMIWSVFIVFVILSTNLNAVSLPCKERLLGARHMHLMSGCPAAVHWAATCAFHAALCAALLVAAAAVAAAALDSDRTLRRADFILSFVLAMILGALAFFSFMYLVSYFLGERGASVLLVAVLIIFGIVTATAKTVMDVLEQSESITFWEVLLLLACYTMPPHAATVAVAKCAYSARLNAYCDLNRDNCPHLMVPESGFDADKCCAGKKSNCYLCMSDYAPGKEMIILSVQFVVFMTLVILIQRGLFNCLYDRIFNARYRNSTQKDDRVDEFVQAEAMFVNKQIAIPKEKIMESNYAMLVDDLHKNYFRIFGKSCSAVRGISFSVKKGECFGLLGVNGAGKSTTFKMLTAEECPTKGDIYANGYFRKETQSYLRSLGYSPQFFGLDGFLTGSENLTLLLTLRGLDARDVSQQVNSWIEIVGLEQYRSVCVSAYSGGCVRRLGTAAALASGAPLTLLDEPTSGVDVAARRRVWAALRRALRAGRAVLITSHSMDEMEALCSRIAIMAGGVIRAVGTPSELRARHAAGYAVVIKLKQHAAGDAVDRVKSVVERLKKTLQHKFNCTLKEEHKTMLHYHINDKMRYSNLFAALEELKATYPSLVEDYSVTETTLEEVFLSIAREQRQEPAPAARNNVV